MLGERVKLYSTNLKILEVNQQFYFSNSKISSFSIILHSDNVDPTLALGCLLLACALQEHSQIEFWHLGVVTLPSVLYLSLAEHHLDVN